MRSAFNAAFSFVKIEVNVKEETRCGVINAQQSSYEQ